MTTAAEIKVVKVSWRQVVAWGWGSVTVTIRYINHRTGRAGWVAGRLVPGQINLRSAYARQNRDADLEVTIITRDVGSRRYLIEPMPITSCKRCGRETWDLPLRRCRGWCL